MKRLLAVSLGCGLAAVLPGFAPPARAASDTKVSVFDVGDGSRLETQSWVECKLPTTTCNFTVGIQLRTADGEVTGFPDQLWARQSTDIYSQKRSAYLDVHADGGPETKVFKTMGSATITTIYQGAGPPAKYQTNGIIDINDYATGQPVANANVIVCSHVQVVYPGVNLMTPDACAQTRFS